MSDVFEEVEEGLRSDKTGVLWSKYAPFVYGVGFLIIAAVGLNEYRKVQNAAETAERIIVFEDAQAALEAGEYVKAEEGFSQLTEAGTLLSPMAANYLARVRLEGGGDLAGAEAALSSQASGDGKPFARLALLKTAYAKADSLSLPELEGMLADLARGEDGISILARELIAAKLYDTGDYVRARKEFSYLLYAPGAPQGVQLRAQVALAVIPQSVVTEETIEIPDVLEDDPSDAAPIEEEPGE